MLTRLLVKLGMMWPRWAAFDGRVGMLSCAAAMEVISWLVAMLIVIVGVVLSMLVMHACGMK